MSTDATRLITSLRSSPFWQSRPDICACASSKLPGIAGLDLIWYYRKHREELGVRFSIEDITAHYLTSCVPNVISPNLAFDEFWYRQRYADADESVKKERHASGWEHYLAEGAASGYNPAFWFDEKWYAKQNPDVIIALRQGNIMCGFEHYLKEGVYTDAAPSMYFNPAWYRNQYFSGDTDRRTPITDYLSKKPGKRPNPAPFFDPDWYRNQYLSQNGKEPTVSEYEHYIFTGRNQAYSPSPHFNESEYRARYPRVRRDIAERKYATALEHYAMEGVENGFFASTHMSTAGMDYQNPTMLRNLEQSLYLNLEQIAQLRYLLRAARSVDIEPRENQ